MPPGTVDGEVYQNTRAENKNFGAPQENAEALKNSAEYHVMTKSTDSRVSPSFESWLAHELYEASISLLLCSGPPSLCRSKWRL